MAHNSEAEWNKLHRLAFRVDAGEGHVSDFEAQVEAMGIQVIGESLIPPRNEGDLMRGWYDFIQRSRMQATVYHYNSISIDQIPYRLTRTFDESEKDSRRR